jgi:hypothetical protein
MATTFIETRYTRRRHGVELVARVLDYMFGLLYALLGIRLLLAFMDARRSAGFVQFIEGLTRAFYAPFAGIVPSQTVGGIHPIVWSIAVAIVAYLLLHAAIRALLRLLARP